MNFVNRLIVLAQLLLAIALMPILVVILLFFRPGIVDAVNIFMRSLVSGPNAFLVQTICVGLAVLVLLIALLMLFLELQRPSVKRLRVPQVTEGQVQVTTDAIINRLEHTILQIADITRVKPYIVSARKGSVVDLALEVEANPNVNVPQKTQEVIAAANQVLEQQMGLKVGKVQVELHHPKGPKS